MTTTRSASFATRWVRGSPLSRVLGVDLGQWGPAVLAGNLPYYITSPILERIFRARAALQEAVLLIQKEVAERITASPNSRDYGYLTVSSQTYSCPECLFQVKPGMFRPPPKVDSAVIRLTLRPDAPDAEAFLQFAARCFAQKRKTLRNNLAPFYGHDLIDALPEGYQSRIGEDGSFLSGGQRQRVGLARAIYGDPTFVLLDEPNSSLDEAGEQALLSMLLALKQRRCTTIIITHRTSVLPAADKILLLRDGQVAGFGPRDDILNALKQAQLQKTAQAIPPATAVQGAA